MAGLIETVAGWTPRFLVTEASSADQRQLADLMAKPIGQVGNPVLERHLLDRARGLSGEEEPEGKIERHAVEALEAVFLISYRNVATIIA